MELQTELLLGCLVVGVHLLLQLIGEGAISEQKSILCVGVRL